MNDLLDYSLVYIINKKQMAVTLLTDIDFKNNIEQHDKVVVKYYADWCGSCKLFAPKFKRLSGDERFEGIQFVEVNAVKTRKPAEPLVSTISPSLLHSKTDNYSKANQPI